MEKLILLLPSKGLVSTVPPSVYMNDMENRDNVDGSTTVLKNACQSGVLPLCLAGLI